MALTLTVRCGGSVLTNQHYFDSKDMVCIFCGAKEEDYVPHIDAIYFPEKGWIGIAEV